jgi:hypothetical protein
MEDLARLLVRGDATLNTPDPVKIAKSARVHGKVRKGRSYQTVCLLIRGAAAMDIILPEKGGFCSKSWHVSTEAHLCTSSNFGWFGLHDAVTSDQIPRIFIAIIYLNRFNGRKTVPAS